MNIHQQEASKRAYVIFLALSIFGFAIVCKVFMLQAFPSEKAKETASSFIYKVRDIESPRGQIFSSDGSLLATSVPEYEIRWDSKAPYDLALYREKIDSLCAGLSSLIQGKSKAYFINLFTEGRKENSRSVKIADHIDYNVAQAIRKLPFANLGQFKSGLILIPRNKRIKPFGDLAARTIGLFRDSNKVGLELAWDERLKGIDGRQLQEKIAGGIWTPMTDDYIVEPQPGADIVSTIDVHLQDVAQSSLKRKLEETSAQWGCAILMEVSTGYVKAIANLSRDPENGTYHEVLNVAITNAIEPGSTMKLPSLLACLDEGLISIDDTVQTFNGVRWIDGRNMYDALHNNQGHGLISVQRAFEVSSNIGTAVAVNKAFKGKSQRFLDKLHSFGLNQPLGIELAGEAEPFVYKSTDTKKGWNGFSLTQMAIGYEVSLTPLQMLTFYNSIANNGICVKPLFVQEILRNGKREEIIQPVVLRKDFLKPETIAIAKRMMEGVVLQGTAYDVFKTCPYTVGGKTGTAWLNDNGYVAGRYRASFVGYFPANNPKYSCIVVVNDPRGGNYYGATVAAPVFKELADKIYSTEMEFHQQMAAADSAVLALKQLPASKNARAQDLKTIYKAFKMPLKDLSSGEWVTTSTKKDTVFLNDRSVRPGLVPDVTGMGLSDAIYLLESQGMKVKVFGYGTVKRQSVAAGSMIRNNKNITIELL